MTSAILHAPSPEALAKRREEAVLLLRGQATAMELLTERTRAYRRIFEAEFTHAIANRAQIPYHLAAFSVARLRRMQLLTPVESTGELIPR
jgi:hypothetical protein